MVLLEFVNIDATPKYASVECAAESVHDIMLWYGSHHAGDRYSVTADGVKLLKDQNGEPVAVEQVKEE